jgi:hypothetical protein
LHGVFNFQILVSVKEGNVLNVKAVIKQIGLFLTTAWRDDINANFNNLAQKDYDNYNELKGISDTHAANLKKDIDNLSFTGSQHDALVTAALVDEEGEDFGSEGNATYIDGRMGKWEQRQASHEAEIMSYEGKKIKINNPYKNSGSLSLRGQLHCHTTNSDGTHTPDYLVAAYRDAGYQFITITDHNIVTPNPNVSGITWLCDSSEESLGKHVPSYDIAAHYAVSPLVQDVINFHKSNRGMCSIAHPDYSPTFINKDELKGYYGYNFLEVYNPVGTTNNEADWDAVLSIGIKAFALAVDDCHTIPDHFNKGWVVVFANENTSAAIKKSLRDGNFYASNGNDLAISIEGNVITATSSEASNISFIGNDGKVLQANNGVTTASYTIVGDEMYIRVKSVKVSDATIAWGQPVFLDVIDKLIPYETPLKTTGNLTFYVRADGNDGNDGTADDAAHAFKTIGRAISKIPQIVNHSVQINVGAGDYSSEVIVLSGFYGKGTIFIYADTALSTTRSILRIEVSNCGMYIRIIGFNCIATNFASVRVLACPWVYLQYINMVQAAPGQQGLGVYYNSGVHITGCNISNKGNAIYAGQCSTVYSDNNTGGGNTTGLAPNQGATIVKNGTQPGATTPESATLGGLIR